MSAISKVNFKRLPVTFLSGIGTLLLSACAGQQACDPSQTELFTGIACMSNGGYQRRADALRNESQNAQQVAILEREKAIKAQHDATLAKNHERTATASLNGQINKLQAQAKNERNQAATLRKTKAQLLKQNAEQEAQLKSAEQHLASVKADPSASAAEIENINKKIAILQAQHHSTVSDLAKSGG